MTGEKVKFDQAAKASETTDEESKYERSTIDFPYADLSGAIEVASAINGRYGLRAETDQVAAELKQTPTSGSFRLKTAAARTFGLTENERGTLTLTDLGREILDPQKMRRSKAEAFLRVPLYKAVFDQFRGMALPPAPALERIMQQLGVSSKQTSKARQVFERSAEQAGYFEAGKDRLVRPGNLGEPEKPKPDETNKDRGSGSGGGGGGGKELHPFIQGLLNELPAPKSDWSAVKRAEWLQAAAQLFKLIYAGGEDGIIQVTFSKSSNNAGSTSRGTGEAH